MSKIKISELAVTINKKNTEIIGALEALAIENNGKRFVANSSIEAEVAERVKSHLGISGAEKNNELKKEAASKDEVKREEAPKETIKEGLKEGAAKEETSKEEAPKKKIFMVTNPQNSSQGYRKGNNQQRQNRSSQSGQNQNGNRQNSGSTQRPAAQGRPVQQNQPVNQDRTVQQEQRQPSQTRTTYQPQSSQNRSGQQSQSSQNRNSQQSQSSQNRNSQQGQSSQNRNSQQGQSSQNRNGQQTQFSQNRNGQQSQSSQSRGGQQSQFSQNRNGQQTQSSQTRTTNNSNNSRRQPERGQEIKRQDAKLPETTAVEKKPERRPEKRQDNNSSNKKNSRPEKQVRGGNPYKKNTAAEQPKPQIQEVKEPEIKTIILPDTVTIKELAEKMKMQPSALVKKLFLQGKMVTINQEIEFESAEEIALEFDVICEKEVKIDVIEELLREDDEDESTMVSRPPVICVMGHVDHGKTSLLDAIRSTNVIAREAGGITQHIGAYVVEINGQKITFLDTPGHEAFTAMRMRGAQSTDIAILVVAADDGVMPQTIEAINHAKAAGIEIIVAINKVDKPSANIDRVKQELIEHELVAEDWGGSTVFVPVSAHTHEGIEELLEMILLTAEVKELKANPKRKARGLVIEAQLDKGKGPVATVLVQKGTLHIGDSIAAGQSHGKVRAMIDDKGRRLKEAGPSTPVEILGLNDVPKAGEIFVACDNEKEARSFAETFISQGKERLLEDTKAKMSLDDLFTQIQAGNVKELKIIVKADVQGSVEAIRQSLVKLSNEEVVVKVIHGGVGAINESDVSLASASNAIIIGFNVRPDVTAKGIADRENVDLRLYKVIYNAIEDVEAAMKGMLDPTFEEKVIGHAEVRQIFKASGLGTIAGSYVLDGKFQRGCSVRITREQALIFEGALASLKRFKDDVKEVNTGYECGLVFEKFNDLKEGDMVEAFIMEEVPR